jgi:hypothetical protein
MPFSKLFKLTISIVVCAVVLVMCVFASSRVRRLVSASKAMSTNKREQESNAPRDWLKVEIQDRVVFYVPSSLQADPAEKVDGYRRFRSSGMEIQMDYGLTQHVTVCAVQNNQMQSSAIKVEPIRVDGKEGRIESIEKIPFNLEDDEKLAVKGFLICVPNVGDDAHEFGIVGKYKSPEDYQTLYRIVDSIKFLNRRG